MSVVLGMYAKLTSIPYFRCHLHKIDCSRSSTLFVSCLGCTLWQTSVHPSLALDAHSDRLLFIHLLMLSTLLIFLSTSCSPSTNFSLQFGFYNNVMPFNVTELFHKPFYKKKSLPNSSLFICSLPMTSADDCPCFHGIWPILLCIQDIPLLYLYNRCTQIVIPVLTKHYTFILSV